MNDYREQEAKVREIAEAKFDATHDTKNETREQRQEKSRFVRDQINAWFWQTELYSSITIDRRKSVEIRDEYYGSSITIYPPERTWSFEDNEQKVRIQPGYMNCSTWNTGQHGVTVEHVQRRTKHYLKMVEIAVDVQNELNQVVLEWEDFQNPMKMTEWKESELKRLKAERDERLQREAEKKAQKLAKSAK